MHSVIMTSGRSHSGSGAGGTARIFIPLSRDAFERSASAHRRRSASAAARVTRPERAAASAQNGRGGGGSGRAEAHAAGSTSAGETHFYPDLAYIGYVSAICFLLCGVVLLFTGLIMTITIDVTKLKVGVAI